MSKEITQIDPDFIEENKKLCQTMPLSKKGGPYSSTNKHTRRNEVYRLHFEYGHSARKIADIMKINRNTISNDVRYWYSNVAKDWSYPDPEYWIIWNLERLEIQRTRLREGLDLTKNIQERIQLERLILDLESKISNIELRLCETIQKVYRRSTSQVNEWMEKNGHEFRCVSFWELFRVSKKAQMRITKIIKDDAIS